MENDTQEIVDTPIEETQEQNDTMLEEISDTPTLEDYEKAQAKIRELEAQKNHWKKKASTIKEEPSKKQTQQSGLSREEVILFAKGHTEEEVELASKLAQINGVSLVEASKDEIFTAKVEKRLTEERSRKASLPASGGSSGSQPAKPIGEMSREEHMEYYKKVMGL
jgi:hypothetical protein